MNLFFVNRQVDSAYSTDWINISGAAPGKRSLLYGRVLFRRIRVLDNRYLGISRLLHSSGFDILDSVGRLLKGMQREDF